MMISITNHMRFRVSGFFFLIVNPWQTSSSLIRMNVNASEARSNLVNISPMITAIIWGG